MENVAVLTEDGTSTLFFRPHPWGFDIQGKNKNMLMPGGQPGRGGGGGALAMGAAGIDWCINIA